MVKNAEIVSSQGRQKGHLLVRQGKVFARLAPGPVPEGLQAQEVIDAQGMMVFPGMVDLHVHIGEPGKEEKEDLSTGTRAAAAGGVTTIAIMPNSVPPVHSATSLRDRAGLIHRKSFVDFCMLGGAGGESVDDIVAQAEAGAVGYKSYVGAYRPDRPGLLCKDTADMLKTLEEVAKTDCFVGFHCEDGPTMRLLQERLVAQGRTDFAAYHPSRPEFTESLATLPLLEVARVTGARLYLVHMSSPWAITLASWWREQGTDVTIETCPHYLLFNEKDTERLGPYAQVAPPLRSIATQQALWDLVNDGTLDVIATDHAPGTPAEKKRGQTNIFAGGGGLPALETVWLTLLDAVKRHKTTAENLAWLMAEHPARIARIYPQKGHLEVGADADMILVNPDATTRFDAEKMYTKNKDAAKIFHGMEVGAKLEMVLQRGQVIAKDLEVTREQPLGAQWVKPHPR